MQRGTSDGPPRIVSLAPCLTEIVCAIGAQDCLVGRSSACDYPPEAVASIPTVGGFGAPSLECLIAVEPTVVLDVDLADETVTRQWAEVGLERERIECRRIDDIPAAIRRIGQLADREEDSESLARGFEARVAELRADAALQTNRPAVYVEIWHNPITTAGGRTFLSELVHLAGGANIAEGVDKDYFRVSSEWVISQDPEIIICAYMSDSRTSSQLVTDRPGWAAIRAVRDGAVCVGIDEDVVLRPGPRVFEGIEVLRECLATLQHR